MNHAQLVQLVIQRRLRQRCIQSRAVGTERTRSPRWQRRRLGRRCRQHIVQANGAGIRAEQIVPRRHRERRCAGTAAIANSQITSNPHSDRLPAVGAGIGFAVIGSSPVRPAASCIRQLNMSSTAPLIISFPFVVILRTSSALSPVILLAPCTVRSRTSMFFNRLPSRSPAKLSP